MNMQNIFPWPEDPDDYLLREGDPNPLKIVSVTEMTTTTTCTCWGAGHGCTPCGQPVKPGQTRCPACISSC